MVYLLLLMFIVIEGIGHPFPPPTPPPLTDFPAVVMAYDPALGGINCDGDCTTIATGKLEPEMYGTIAACPPELLYRRIDIPTIGQFDCLDTGGLINVSYNKHFEREVIYFDILYDLTEDRPVWAGTLITGWEIVD